MRGRGVRNDGDGRLWTGIRSKSRGGENVTIQNLTDTTNALNVSVDVNTDVKKKAYIQIPHTYNNNIYLIISGTGTGLTQEALINKISDQWRWFSYCDDTRLATDEKNVHYDPKHQLYLTNVLVHPSKSRIFYASYGNSKTQIQLRLTRIPNASPTSPTTYKLTYQKYNEHLTCANPECSEYLTHMNGLYGANDSDWAICGKCSFGHCENCGSMLNKDECSHCGHNQSTLNRLPTSHKKSDLICQQDKGRKRTRSNRVTFDD